MNAIAQPSPTLAAAALWERTRGMFARAVATIGAPAAIAAMTLMTRSVRRDIVGWVALLETIVRKLLLVEAAVLKQAELARAEHGPRLIHIPLCGMAQHWTPELARARSPSTRGEGAGGGVNPTARSKPQASTRSARRESNAFREPPQGWTAGLQARTCSNVSGRSAPEGARSNIHARAHNIDLTRPETWSARFAFAIPRDPRLLPNSRAPRILNPWGPPPPPPPPVRSTPKPEQAPFRLARRLEGLRRVLEDPLPHARRLARVLSRELRRVARVVERFAFACMRSDFYDRADPRLHIQAMAAAATAQYDFPDSS